MGIPPHHVDGHAHALGGKRKVSTACKWYPARVSHLLHETIYMGLHIWGKRSKKSNKELVRRNGPAIVSSELWQKAQETLQRNFRFAKRNAKHDYLLSSLVKCGFCNRTMTGVTVAGKRYYYRCNATMLHFTKRPEPCPARHLPKDWIEGIVWNELHDWILHHANLEEIITEALQEQDRQRQEWRATHTRLRADIRLKDEERERIITAYRKGWLSNGDLERELMGIEKERRQLEQAASDLEKRYDLHLDLEETIATIRK
jgi:site-specific DNA recombinase